MITRAKDGIFKPRALLSDASPLSLTEPTMVQQALQSPEWTAAMKAEFDALFQNNTWTLVPLPAGNLLWVVNGFSS